MSDSKPLSRHIAETIAGLIALFILAFLAGITLGVVQAYACWMELHMIELLFGEAPTMAWVCS